jgi:hypothetical protein
MQPEVAHVVVTLEDGFCCVMSFVTVGRGNVLPSGATWFDDSVWHRPATDSNIDAEIARAGWAGAQPVSWRLANSGDIGTDPAFRAARKDSGTAIVHDMPKSREIHRDRVRDRRKKAFEQLDAEWMRAIGQNRRAEADAIEAQRQLWRDAPANPLIDSAQTVEQLQAVTLPGA